MSATYPQSLTFAAATTDLVAAREFAAGVGGTLLADEREPYQHLPFRGLLIAVSDDLEPLEALADVSLSVVCARLVKAGDYTVAGVFPMIRRADLTHRQADDHWRDRHAPLALHHHAAMTHYTQLSVVRHLSGTEYDGYAICAFASEEDLRERFFTHPESPQVIAEDVAKFADTRRSPRRLIARPL